jgi:hypothetical protein
MRTTGRSVGWIAMGAIAGALWSAEAWAHSAGQPGGGCSGCHNNGDYDIFVSTSPGMISPGSTVTVTVQIESPSGAEAGLFIDANAGSMDTISGQGLAEVAAGLTHSSPKSLSGGQVSFSFEWTAPSEPGAVRFEVWTLVANNNNSSSGDMANDGQFDFVFGCPPQQYFRDFDADGYGRATSPLVHCSAASPAGYVIPGDDCDDNNAEIFPGATEYCNLHDDNCNGEVDEDALPLALYPDADDDGYYGLTEYQSGDTVEGCVGGTPGYAGFSGDCAPQIAEINPGAEEICNLYDDNCDGRIDEDVRPLCGEGWCRREANTCEPDSCFPGEPREEECNLFDDDCDGVADNDVTCPDGQVCVAGVCREGSAPGGSGGADDDGDDGASGGGDGAATETSGTTAGTGPSQSSSDGGGCRVGAGAPAWLGLFALGLGAFVRRRLA